MPDGREDQQQLVTLVGVERVLWAYPARVDALLAVALRIRVVRCPCDEEPGVEADLHLRGGDPARPRHQSARIFDHKARLLLELAYARACRVVIVVLDCAAGEDPG